jgi:hypothetical protein
MRPNLIAPQLSIMGKEITARAWNIQLTPNSTRKTHVSLATKLTKKASSKNKLCKIEPQQRSWGFYLKRQSSIGNRCGTLGAANSTERSGRATALISPAHTPTEEHMLLYKFGAAVGTRVVLTKDKTGSTLPTDGRPWKALGTTRVDTSTSDIGADCADIIAALEKQGFFVFPTSQTKPSAA